MGLFDSIVEKSAFKDILIANHRYMTQESYCAFQRERYILSKYIC